MASPSAAVLSRGLRAEITTETTLNLAYFETHRHLSSPLFLLSLKLLLGIPRTFLMFVDYLTWLLHLVRNKVTPMKIQVIFPVSIGKCRNG